MKKNAFQNAHNLIEYPHTQTKARFKMTVQKLTKEQEIEQAYQQRNEQEKKQKSDAWELADKELEHQQKQSV